MSEVPLYGLVPRCVLRTTPYLLYTSLCTGELNAIRKHKCFLCCLFYERACWAMLGSTKTSRTLRCVLCGTSASLIVSWWILRG